MSITQTELPGQATYDLHSITYRETVRTEVLKYWCQEVNSGRRQGRSCGYTRVNRSIEDKTHTGSVMWAHTGQQVNRRQDTHRVGHVGIHGSTGQ